MVSVRKQTGPQCVHSTTHTYAIRTYFYFTAAQVPSTLRRFHKRPLSSPGKQNVFVHTSILVSFSLVHTKTLKSDKNDWDLG